jgi:hypothetical protein
MSNNEVLQRISRSSEAYFVSSNLDEKRTDRQTDRKRRRDNHTDTQTDRQHGAPNPDYENHSFIHLTRAV